MICLDTKAPLFNLRNFSVANKNTKIKVFIEFFVKEYKVDNYDDFQPEFFSNLDIKFLIESLEYYIKKQNVTAKITARNYITSITNFFNMLANDYDIKNEIFRSFNDNNRFKQKAELIISTLKGNPDKAIATADDYKKLNVYIEEYSSDIDKNLIQVYSDIDSAITKQSSKCDLYYNFISCITVRMTIVYGFKNNIISNMKIEDIDLLSNTIRIGTFDIKFDNVISEFIPKYLECRNSILMKYDKEETILFIDHHGDPFFDSNGGTKSEKLFKIVKPLLGNLKIQLLSNRRVIDMIRSGQDVCTIAGITGNSEKTCLDLQKLYNDSIDLIIGDVYEDIKPFAFESEEKVAFQHIQKDKMICPVCHSQVSSSEVDWVLVLRDDNTKHLACSLCKGGII